MAEKKPEELKLITMEEIHDYFTPRDPGLSFAQTH